jgi:GntR family transcriptional regulator
VRRALARLEAEGRIERRRGSGTYAREQGREDETRRNLSPALDDRAAAPAEGSSRTIAWQRIRTPAFLLAEQPAFGAFTVLIRRVRYFERQPFTLETAYLADAVGGELPRSQVAADGSAMLAVLAALGHPCPILEREFAAIEADPLAARSLGVAVGAPLFNVRTLARDGRRSLVACINCLYRPDRYEARTVIDIGDSRRQRAGARS